MESITLRQVVPDAFADDPEVRASDVWGRDVTFRKGECYLVEAASGSGKSSLCSFLYGWRNDYAGRILFGGEDCRMTSLRRQNPRRDELSDMHQGSAMQFALVSLVGILVIVGFIYTTLNLIDRSIVHIIPPMLLPALAMCALAISDIRYLWLEHDAGTEGDDED